MNVLSNREMLPHQYPFRKVYKSQKKERLLNQLVYPVLTQLFSYFGSTVNNHVTKYHIGVHFHMLHRYIEFGLKQNKWVKV